MRQFILFIVAAIASVAVGPALSAPLSGVVTITLNGSFKTPVSRYGSVKCKGFLALAPDNAALQSADPSGGRSPLASIASLGAALLFRGGVVNTEAPGVVFNAGQKFTCTIAIPYRWQNVSPGQQMVIFYDAAGSDLETKPGKSHQVISIIAVPPNGTNTAVSAQPFL